MNTYRIAMSSNGHYIGQRIELPDNFTAADVTDAVNTKFGTEYYFIGVYPYGPYKRATASNLTLILAQV